MKNKLKLTQILERTRSHWDNDRTRSSVRQAFEKALACRTPALGALVFTSDAEVKLIPCTCKSRACSSCGQRARSDWLREQLAGLPNIPYKGITLTMPDVLWPLFRDDRKLFDYLAALAARMLSQWARQQYDAQLLITVVPHSFGRYVTFHPHLHLLVSAVGLRRSDCKIIPLTFNRERLMHRWRKAVIVLLQKALEAGAFGPPRSPQEMDLLLRTQSEQWWSIHIAHCKSRWQFLSYIARYVRHPAIAEHRIVEVNEHWVVFWSNDHKLERRTETWREPTRFVDLLAEHIPERYRHSVRHFDLLSPPGKNRSRALIFELLCQQRRERPKRISWTFCNRNLLTDAKGQLMKRKGWIKDSSTIAKVSDFCARVQEGGHFH